MSDLFDDGEPAGNAPALSVSQLSGAVKRVIEGEFGRVRVRGEVGRATRARTGHLYFDLKDERAVVACVSWKGQVARFAHMPEEGMEVIATGRMTTYGPQSKYQLNVENVQPAGAGALMAMLEKRKAALAAEGLFAPDRKKPIPYLPEVIGVVTSPSGAVIRDILHRLRERFPRKVLVWPAAVQGANCAAEVAAALRGFNRLSPGGALPRPDVLVVARGGGSLEDLWGFNEEAVVRAVAESDIPVISAVGHETDTTLVDYAADRRAPTPTAAAEMAVPVRSELMAGLAAFDSRRVAAVARRIEAAGQRLRDLSRALPRAESILNERQQRLDGLAMRLPEALLRNVQQKQLRLSKAAIRPNLLVQDLHFKRQKLLDRARQLSGNMVALIAHKRLVLARHDVKSAPVLREIRFHRQNLAALERTYQNLHYENTLKRGFAIVRGDGAVVTSVVAARKAKQIELEFADGRTTLGTPKPKSAPKKPTPDQGSLF